MMRVLLGQLCPVPVTRSQRGGVAEACRAPGRRPRRVPGAVPGGLRPRRAREFAVDPDARRSSLAPRGGGQRRRGRRGLRRARRRGYRQRVALMDERGELAVVYRKRRCSATRRGVRGGDGWSSSSSPAAASAPGLLRRRVPEPARALAVAGAELLVTAAANMEPFDGDHALAARARALDNRLPHLYVNRAAARAGCASSAARG